MYEKNGENFFKTATAAAGKIKIHRKIKEWL